MYLPKIPNTAINMFSTFAGNTNLSEAPVIPNNVENMQNCFIRCANLKRISMLL